MNKHSEIKGHTNGFQQSDIKPRLYSINKPPPLEDFKKLTTESSSIEHPLAATIERNVPIYHLPDYASLSPEQRSALQDEWNHILLSGPGVFVTKDLHQEHALINQINEVYATIITEGKNVSGQRGDHFAGTGANDRIWNSLSKHCLSDADSFVKYYSNPWLPHKSTL